MPGRLGTPDALTRAAPEEIHHGPRARKRRDQQPDTHPASAQLPRPAPRQPRSPPRPARVAPTCAAAGSLRDGSPSPRAAGGVSWRLRFPGRGQVEHAAPAAVPAAWLPPPRSRSGFPDLPVPPPGAAPGCAPASAPPPALPPAQRWRASSLVARGGCPDSRANQRAASRPRTPLERGEGQARKSLGHRGALGPFRPARFSGCSS